MTTTAISPATSRFDHAAIHPWSVARPAKQAPGFGDVIDLLNAAGPLTVTNIAGALGRTRCEATIVVRDMIRRRCLASDEWSRYRLAGACRD